VAPIAFLVMSLVPLPKHSNKDNNAIEATSTHLLSHAIGLVKSSRLRI